MEGGKNCIETVLFGTVCDDCNGAAIYQIIKLVIKIMTMGIGILAVLGIIIAGIVYLTSGDNVAKAQKAKRRIFEIVIGLVAYAVLFAVVHFIIPGGIVTPTGSCTEAPVVPQGSGSSGGASTSGKYPMATVKGKASPGNIVCPRNANYTYVSNPVRDSSKGKIDKYFQSVAVSCPFREAVEYSDNAADEACASGGTMHYDASRGWCLVNSKIDVFQYQAYLQANHIKQDGKTCTTDGGTCSDSKDDNLNDYGACEYFSQAFASNLNNGEVLSNDAYAAMSGIAAYDAFAALIEYGNTKITKRNGKEAMAYDDHLSDISLNTPSNLNDTPLPKVYSGPKVGSMSDAKEWLKKGYAVVIGVHKLNAEWGKNCGHYMVAVGYVCSGGSSCGAGDLVVLNTNQDIKTLSDTIYDFPYDRCGG